MLASSLSQLNSCVHSAYLTNGLKIKCLRVSLLELRLRLFSILVNSRAEVVGRTWRVRMNVGRYSVLANESGQ